MAMKIDKEYLVKHHFWFMLAAYLPLVVLSLVLLWTSVAGAIDKRATDLKSLKDKVKTNTKPDAKNMAWIDAATKKAEALAKQKNKVWSEVWNGQAAIFTWPEPLAHLDALDYGDKIDRSEDRDTYINDKKCYSKQLTDMVALVQPVNNKGEGVVQFRDNWKTVINHVEPWFGKSAALTVPSSEEIWLAQEDLWVQRELLQIIRDTNDGLAVYEKSKFSTKPLKDEIDRQVFENPRWRIEIGISRDQMRYRITNRSSRQQTLGFVFRVSFKPAGTKELWVDGEPLAPNQTSPEKALTVAGANWGPSIKLDGVSQVLDWHSAPIKRIDRIDLTRTANISAGRALVPFRGFASDEKKDEPSPNPMSREMPMPGVRGREAKSGLGLDKVRYLESSDQVRRMPLAILLIVDQSNVQDVLTTFARSRMRFQVTQVEWKRYRGSIQPVILADDGRPEAGAPAAMRRPPMPGVVGFDPRRMTPMPRPDRPGPNVNNAADENEEDSSNLVELAVYGIASLYHKYPPKSATPDAAPAATPTPVPAPTPTPAPVPPKPPAEPAKK
jgi:hypothetical protein